MVPGRLGAALVAPVVAVLIAFSAKAEQDSPRTVIEEFHAVLVNVMKEAEALGYGGRYEWLAPVIEDTFNLEFMARVTAGRYWNKAGEPDRERYLEAFRNMSVAMYASRFDDYAGEEFEILAAEEAPRDSVIIKSNIIKSDGEKVPINYLLRKFEDRWRVIDVYLKGAYSELATRKSEYGSIIRSRGFEGLIGALKDKVVSLSQEASAR